MRLVFDTVILVRGLISPHGQWGRLLFDYADDYVLILSPPILTEYLEVIQRPELVRKYRGVAGRDTRAILDLLANAEVVEPEEAPEVARDPKDDPFLAAAQTGSVDYLVSEDHDLLDLGDYEGIPIISARMLLSVLERNASIDH